MAKGDSLSAGYNVIGHYRTSAVVTLADTQAAAARLFTLRNTGQNLLIPTRLTMRVVQAAAGTVQLALLSVFRLTSFTVTDNTNSAAPTAIAASNQGYMTAAPGNAELQRSSGAAAGMTGGTLTKDAAPFLRLPMTVLAAANAYLWQADMREPSDGAHPIVLQNNEGLLVENTNVNSTTFGMTLYVDLAWAEVKSYGQ